MTRLLVKWLDEFGLRSAEGELSVNLITDAEKSVANFISGSSRYTFAVKRAAPHSHESAGHAERAVRTIKEGLKTLWLECQNFGLAVIFSKENLQRQLNWVCFSRNNFALSQGSKHGPRALAVGKKVTPDSFTLFGAKVLAELSQSVIKESPNAPRFAVAGFLHPDFGSMGSVVIANIRVGQEMVRRKFTAKAIKICLPIELLNEFGLFVSLVDEKSGLPIQRGAQNPDLRSHCRRSSQCS